MWRTIFGIMSVHALIGFAVLVLISGLPLIFTWRRFLQQRTSEATQSHLTLEFPLFVVTGSCLLFFVFLAQVILFPTLPDSIGGHVPALAWSNAGLSFAMGLLALIGKHSLRWRLVGSAGTVSMVWLLVGLSILAVESAGRWVL